MVASWIVKALMYSQTAISACLQVFQVSRQISSVLRGLKKVSTAELSKQFPLPLKAEVSCSPEGFSLPEELSCPS
jgi:hypothetical protein